MSEPRSILICRLSAMGDVVLSIPVADALRERYPNAQIAFLSREPWANILHCVPSISRVLVWPGPGAPLPDEAARRSWDLVIDLSVTGRSRRLLRGVRGGRFLRARKETLRRFAFVHLRRLGGGGVRITPAVDRLFSALAPLGMTRSGRVPRLATGKVMRDPKRILIAPGGGRGAKLWPAERFRALVRALCAQGNRVVLMGSENERALLEEVAADAPRGSVEIAAGLDLRRLPEQVVRCTAAVTNDSGLLHVAEACGVPVLALFGPTHPRLGFAPLRSESRAIHIGIDCSPCDLHGPSVCPRTHHRCLREIDEVRVRSWVEERLAAAAMDSGRASQSTGPTESIEGRARC
jgi:heptosyltransferase-2